MLCGYCHTKNNDNAKFCQECGINLLKKDYDQKKTTSLIKINMLPFADSFEAAIKQQELLLDKLPYIAWIKDINGKYLYANQSYALLCQVKQADIPGKTDYDFFEKDQAQVYIDNDNLVIQSKQLFIVEEPFLENTIVESIKVPFLNNNGEVVATIGVAKDISYRGLLNQQLYDTNMQLQKYIDKFKETESKLLLTKKSLDLTPVAAHWVDKNARFIMMNQSARESLGYSEEEFTSIRVWDIAPFFPRESWDEHWKLWKKNKFAKFETIEKRKDGSTHPVEVNLTFFEFDDKELIYVNLTDLSERKHYEKELLEQNKELQKALNKVLEAESALKLSEMSLKLSSIPIIWVGPQAQIHKVNSAACKYLGYSEEELLSMTIHDINPNYQTYNWHENWEKWKKQGSTIIKTSHITKNGIIIPVEVSANFIEFDKKELMFAYIQDVTERKKYEEEILKRNNELQLALNKVMETESALKQSEMSIQLSSTPFQWIDANANMYKVNQAACDILGYSEEELTSMSIHDIDPIYQKEKWVKSWELWKNNQHLCFETIHRKKDGTLYPVEVSVNFIVFNNQEFIFAYFNDISERKRLEKALEDERNKLSELVKQRTIELDNSLMILKETNIKLQNAIQHKNRFISSMSHELRTPLNAVIGFTQALEKQYFGDLNEKQMEYVQLVESSGQHLLSLINDILDVSRIDAGSMDFIEELIDVNEVIKEVISIIDHEFKVKEISLSYDVAPDMAKLAVDVRKLKQILINLLSNALKFTPQNGKVTIKCVKQDNDVKFIITDSGFGISNKDKPHIFEEFYQSDKVKEMAFGGAGIGLSLVKRFVEMHKGTIGFESEEDKGSSFWFTIPIKSASEKTT